MASIGASSVLSAFISTQWRSFSTYAIPIMICSAGAGVEKPLTGHLSRTNEKASCSAGSSSAIDAVARLLLTHDQPVCKGRDAAVS